MRKTHSFHRVSPTPDAEGKKRLFQKPLFGTRARTVLCASTETCSSRLAKALRPYKKKSYKPQPKFAKLRFLHYTEKMKQKRIFAALALFAAFFFFACRKTKSIDKKNISEFPRPETHRWYSFFDGEIKAISSFDEAPIQMQRPWTEAVRIAAFGASLGDGKNVPNAYALVNRTGIIVFREKDFSLYKDESIFANRSVGKLFFENDVPVFSLYKSDFFNADFYNNENEIHHFLVQFDAETNVAFPLITCDNLGLSANEEITDFVWDGQTFVCAVKKTGKEKNEFSYLSVQPKTPLLSVSNGNAKKNLFITNVSSGAYRNEVLPKDFSDAPKRLQTLLFSLDKDTPIFVSLQNSGGVSARNFSTQKEADALGALQASALIADTYACALFEDGTVFFQGSLFEKHVINGGAVFAFRLPLLPQGFSYTSFSISGSALYAAWEENDFYKTMRAGFLSIDLDEILY